jgi:ribonuclease BN (tRNA processing enzyme)
VDTGEGPPIILDLGTGLRTLGLELDASGATADGLNLVAFLSHLHWDHIIGLPFFTTAHSPRTTLDIYGPAQAGATLHETFERVLQPPFFPIKVEELEGDIRLTGVSDEEVSVGAAKVKVRRVPHVGTTLGFRIEAGGAAIAFVSDHQQPEDPQEVDSGVLELCDGVDLLIHDAQYTDEEFKKKATWGHSTVAYAVHVAAVARARNLVLFHHDPLHEDDDVDRLLEQARGLDEAGHLEGILAASEGLALDVESAKRPERILAG